MVKTTLRFSMNRTPKAYQFQNSIFYGLACLVFIVFFFVTIWGKDGLIDLMALKKQRAKIAQSNYYLLKENLLYLEEIDKLKQARFVEQNARSDMGMVRSNEIVYVVK